MKNFKVGNEVKIVKRWGHNWIGSMNNNVNKNGIVLDVSTYTTLVAVWCKNGNNGHMTEKINGKPYWWYNIETLKKINRRCFKES